MKIYLLFFLIPLLGCHTLGTLPTPNIVPGASVNGGYQPPPPEKATYIRADSKFGPPKPETLYESDDLNLALSNVKMKQVSSTYEKIEDPACQYVARIDIPDSRIGVITADTLARKFAAQLGANRVQVPELNDREPKAPVSVRAFRCGEFIEGAKLQAQLKEARATTSLSVFAGQYMQRYGYLEALGEKVPTFGIEIDDFFLSFDDGRYQKSHWGWYLLWSFDHYLNTDSQFLKEPFKGKDFTSYFLSAGFIYRQELSEKLFAQYSLGLGNHFNEIDTFGGGNSKQDELFSDRAYSAVHKLGIFYGPTGKVQYGVSGLYYYAPNLLGKFANENAGGVRDPGGSWSLLLEVKTESF